MSLNNSNTNKYRCEECGERFNSLYSLNQHYIAKHTIPPKPKRTKKLF